MYKYRRVIVSVIACVLALLLIGGLVISAFAATSGEIKQRIEGLQQQEAAIEAQKQALQKEIEENKSDLQDLVQKKNQIDQQIKLTQDAIENKNDQIQEYNLLIAEKQNELDDALSARDQLNEQYRARIRSMEENGKLTYWSILFKASSFSDLLDRVDLINEIALADSRMIGRIQEAAQQIELARQELAIEKVALEEAKQSLAEEEQTLVDQRAEADDVFAELMDDRDAMLEAAEKYEAQKEALLAQIAVQEANYKEAVAAEEKARREAEEAAARAREEAAAQAAAAREDAAVGGSGSGSGSGGSSSGSGSGSGGSSSGSGTSAGSGKVSKYGFIWPCASHYITCHFGPRIHPITGKYSNHSGTDIGASYGSPIYACASGTVTSATFGNAYGYHVVINHGNGFSTLYAHMCRFVVAPGQYVTRGQVIGYVGSTGMSTGPHLHLTMYYNGALVNPLIYLP